MGLANALQSKGDLKRRLGELEKAMELYGEAKKLYQSEQDNLGLANIFRSKGNIFMKQNKPQEAVKIYERALLLYQDEKDIMGYAYTMSELCRAYSLCGEHKKVSKIITELNQIFDKVPYENIKNHIRNRIQEADDILKNLP